MTNTAQAGTIEELMADVQETADYLNVPVADVTWDIIRAFEPWFLENPVGFRITSKDEQELNVRYQTLKPQDTYRKVVEMGFLEEGDHPVYDIMPELQDMRPDGGYFLDIGVTHGIEKLWGFFEEPLTTEEVANMDSMPESIKKNMDLMKEYELDWISTIGVDYQNQTVNIYFLQGAFPNSPEIATQFVKDAGYPAPPAEDAPFNGSCFVLYLTFSWDSDEMLRISYARAGEATLIPDHFADIIHNFAETVPLRGDLRTYTFNTCYRLDGSDYNKIEADYRDTIKTTVGPLIEGGMAARERAQNS